MADLIDNYIRGRAKLKLEPFDKAADGRRRNAELGDLAAVDAEVAAERAEIESRFVPNAWLSDAAKLATQISLVTHPLKFTHPNAKGTSAYVRPQDTSFADQYLTTASLASPQIDIVGNAAALGVAGLFRLEHKGVKLADLISLDDMSAFRPFAQNDDQLEEWRQGFKRALTDRDLRSHTLAKQLFFPVSDGGYHLVSPLYASSLAHALYERIVDSRYTDTAKATRQSRRESKYSALDTVDFPSLAVQTFGGTKPQNVSQLNSSHRGKSFLLSCEPPVWDTRLSPPSSGKDAFWRMYEKRVWRTVKRLKGFLLEIAGSDGTRVRRDVRADYVDQLIEMLFQCAAEIQALVDCAGWSENSRLSRAEQLWLDPLRTDEAFQAERREKDWQQDISNQFAGWLNRNLKDKNLLMGDAEYREWSKLLGRRLAMLREDLEVVSV